MGARGDEAGVRFDVDAHACAVAGDAPDVDSLRAGRWFEALCVWQGTVRE
jgi:hypothetical protein